MVPALELSRGIGKITGVYKPQQRGAGEAGAAEIEDEINQCIELVLIDVGGHELVDASLRASDVAGEEGVSLVLRDGQAGVYPWPVWP